MPPRKSPPKPAAKDPTAALETAPTVFDFLREAGVARPDARPSLWEGPDGSGPNGGITYSLLCRFLSCRERFRARVVDGWGPAERFNHSIEYGNLWHVCEEAHSNDGPRARTPSWPEALKNYGVGLVRRYPLAGEDIDKWYSVCKVQFPIYLNYWKDHPDTYSRRPILAEVPFDVAYPLPSGRVVRLRGKWDAVDWVEEPCPACKLGQVRPALGEKTRWKSCKLCDGEGVLSGVYSQENKTKGDIDAIAVERQLGFDLQTGLYGVALAETLGRTDLPARLRPLADYRPEHLRGVRYNVVRRPLSGGKGSIRQHKPSKSNPKGESKQEFYGRLGTEIADAADTYFFRRKVEVKAADRTTFRAECLDPILEQLWDWWEGIVAARAAGRSPFRAGRGVSHFRFPFGVWNPLTEVGWDDLDDYVATGNTAGLERREDLFPELADPVPPLS